jgi:hypothetical protein
MARIVGDRLPPDLVALFSGADLAARVGLAYPLVTVDDSGAPRLSMLSAGELLAVSDRAVRVGLWPGTGTGANLAAGRAALLCVVEPGSVRYVRGVARRLSGSSTVECFEMAVHTVELDGHDGMPVATGITFDVVGPSRDDVLADWRARLAVLAAAR